MLSAKRAVSRVAVPKVLFQRATVVAQRSESMFTMARSNKNASQALRTRMVWLRSCATSTKVDEAASSSESTEKTTAENTETVAAETEESHTFQAETAQLLNIVAKSLYTDKEVFLRELISNASDALEKLRYMQQANAAASGHDADLRIDIFTDAENGTLTIQDSGIGMTREEMVNNLGKIANSGTRAFVAEKGTDNKTEGLIGQFGVGFYSSFMVGDQVQVFSQSVDDTQDGYSWHSDGSGSYKLAQASGVKAGTKIVIQLNEESKNFGDEKFLAGIVKKYSNFVGFPVYLNGEKLNSVQAIWTMDKNSVTEEQHLEFYRFIAGAWDAPQMRLSYNADVPLSIKTLLYVPGGHMEKMGMGRMDPGVGLYSRKVLIQPKSEAILPDWLRFMKGVVDCEDIPLNISRESMQDSSLVRKLNRAITSKVVRWLKEESKKKPEDYQKFYDEFGGFLKEGICMDGTHRHNLIPLMRYESSAAEGSTSFDEYVERMGEEQNEVYYLTAPSRALAEASPYYEAFKSKGIEVFFAYENIDPFVMDNIREYKDKKVVYIEASNLDMDVSSSSSFDEEATTAFCAWLSETLGSGKVAGVKPSKRLVSSPCIVVNHDSAAYKQMMKLTKMDTEMYGTRQELEINMEHNIVVRLNEIRDSNPKLAGIVAEQVYDNALVAAGILDDPRSMIDRINELMEACMDNQKS